jgi:hypothetical protein
MIYVKIEGTKERLSHYFTSKVCPECQICANTVPDSATRSTLSSPCLWKNLIRRCNVAFGGGRFLLASFMFAVFESFLPKGSSQYGPPLCEEITLQCAC